MAKDRKPAPAQPDKPPLISIDGTTDEFGRPVAEEKPERPPGYNAADEKQVAEKKREAGQERRQDRDFWRIAMSTPERRAAFYRLLERCHIYGSAADLGARERQSDPYRSYFSMGEENVGKQMMLAAQDASLDLYLTMLKEQKELRDAKDRKDDAS